MTKPTQAQIEAAAKALFDNFAGDDAVWSDSFDKDYWLNQAKVALTAAIRALKDKPQTDPNLIYPGKDADFVFPEE